MADALDRGHAQKVRDISSSLKDGNLHLSVEAASDADLEIWAANQAAEVFHESYSQPIFLQRSRKSA
jgi:hypothetical protein